MTKKVIALSMLLLAAVMLFAACSRPANVREFFDANQSEWAELVDEMNTEAEVLTRGTGIEMSITLEIYGNDTLVYNFIYGPNTEFLPTIGQDLDNELALMTASTTMMAQELRRAMGIDVLYVQMRYLDSNGNVLAERTFAGH
ncbi:MAG: DUF4854 domain-containing protein [Defluviitaleaceae bacterium]|nr:DUF4854 domain-containing protein [Defluviitaleaceae bacterium]